MFNYFQQERGFDMQISKKLSLLLLTGGLVVSPVHASAQEDLIVNAVVGFGCLVVGGATVNLYLRSRHQQQVDSLTQEITALETKLAEPRQENKALLKKVTELESKLNACNASLNSCNGSNREEVKKAFATTKKDITDLRNKFNDFKKHNAHDVVQAHTLNDLFDKMESKAHETYERLVKLFGDDNEGNNY